jgi:hypothetical protein
MPHFDPARAPISPLSAFPARTTRSIAKQAGILMLGDHAAST